MANDVEVDPGSPFLLDIMEAGGAVFEYPNRVWRSDLIEEFRKLQR